MTMMSASDIDAAYKPTKTRTTICLDADLVLQIERLEEQMELARGDQSAASQETVIAAEIVALREQAKTAEVEFVFRDIGRLANRDLRRAHLPTDEQKAEVAEASGGKVIMHFNPDTYLPALFAAACETPTGTDLSWWTRKCREWGDGQINRLWGACLAAQEGVVELPKAQRAYELTRLPAQKPE